MIAQLSAGTWTEIIVASSIFVPIAFAAILTVVVLRGGKDDPDEQRWRRLEEQRREADPAADGNQ